MKTNDHEMYTQQHREPPEPFDGDTTMTNETTTTKHPVRTIIRGIFLLIVAFVLTWIWLARHQVPLLPTGSSQPGARVFSSQDKERLVRMRAAVRRKVEDAFRRNAGKRNEAWNDFMREISDTNLDDATVERTVDAFVDKLDSLKEMKTIAVCFARDKIKHRHTLDAYLARNIREDLMPPVEKEWKKNEEALARLDLALRENNALLRRDLLDIADDVPYDADLDLTAITEQAKRLQTTIPPLKKELAAIAGSEGGLALGAVFSGTLHKVVKSGILHAFGPILRRFAAKSSASSVLIAVDGPLPFGDIAFAALEAGFLAWDAHSLYKAKKALHNNLRNRLVDSMKQTRKDLREQGCSQGKAVMTWYDQATRNTRTRIEKKLDPDS